MAEGLAISPTEQLLERSAAKLQSAINPEPLLPGQVAPSLIQAFETTANQYGVPVDALLAIAEKDSGLNPLARSRGPGEKRRGIINISDEDMAANGINPFVPEQALSVAGRKLRGYIDAGMSVEDAIKAHAFGADRTRWDARSDEYLNDVTTRARRFADALYPVEAGPEPRVQDVKPPVEGPGVMGTAKDLAVSLKSGFDAAAMDLSGVAAKILPERVMEAISNADKFLTGKTTKEIFEENAKATQQAYSPKMRESLAKKWWDQDKGEFGDAFSDWRSYAGPVLQSLPETLLSSGPALKLAKGAYALNIARGATPAVAASRAATVGTLAGAVTEGALGGAQSEREVKKEIEALPFETLRKSEAFKAMVDQGMSEEAARAALAKDAGAQAFITGGIATGIFGGMGDRVLARTFFRRAGGNAIANMLKRYGAAAVGEGLLEEMPQSAFQQMAQNIALQKAEPDKRVMDDVVNQALGGAVTGAVMGVGLGGAYDKSSRDLPAASEAGAAQPSAVAPSAPGAALGAPEPVAPSPAPPPEPVAKPRRKGPISAAVEAGSPNLVEASLPAGREVTVVDAVGTQDGVIVSQDGDGILFKTKDGQEFLYSPEDIAKGDVKIAPIGSVAPTQKAPIADVVKSEVAEPATASSPSSEPQAFAPETGTLGVPREEMPQIKSEHHGALVNHLNAKGIAHETTTVDPTTLKPTQDTFVPEKVEAAKDAEGNRSIIVSNDGHIIDGHHQALAAAEKGDPVKAIILDAPAEKALEAVKGFPSAETPLAASSALERGPVGEIAAKSVAIRPGGHADRAKNIAEVDEPELRARMKFLAEQAKVSGWTKLLMKARQQVEHEIAIRQREAGNSAPASPSAISPEPVAPVPQMEAPAEKKRKAPKEDAKPKVTPLNDDANRYAVASGAQLYSKIGRALDRAPKWNESTKGMRTMSIGRQNAWLVREVQKEAEARGDAHMAGAFSRLDPKNFSQSDRDMVNTYLFDDESGPSDKHFVEPTPAALADVSRPQVVAPPVAANQTAPEQRQSEANAVETRHEAPTAPLKPDDKAEVAPEKDRLDAASESIDAKIDEAEAELAAIMKKMSKQLNSGVPPELLTVGLKLGTLYVAKGVVDFGRFAKAIYSALRKYGVEHDMEKTAPYIKGLYYNLKAHVDDATFEKMDDDRSVRAFDVKTIKFDDEAAPESQQAAAAPQAEDREAQPTTRQEQENVGPSIHGEDSATLEAVSPEKNGEAEKGRPVEQRGAEGEQGGGGASGVSDAGGGAASRGRGNRVPRSDLRQTGKPGRGRGRAEGLTEANAPAEQAPEQDAAPTPALAPINIPAVDFEIADEHEIGKGGEAQKFADNLAAIRTLKQIEAEGRRATPAEQATLARYVGWGGIKNAFRVAGASEGEGVAKGWEKRVAEIEGLLTPDELRAARNSTVAAHYTSPKVVSAMWRAVERLGFDGGSVLEPSVGAGNFLGLMPKELRGKSQVFAVEYDSLTARIAQLLYPNAHIVHSGFQDVPIVKNKFALAIGNPPFGKDSLYFRYSPAANGKMIHNQFFQASLEALEPGGVLSMVVSHYLMDALDPSSRYSLAENAEFIGSIRLPDTAFKENARTDVVTDIVFLKKRTKESAEIAAAAIAQLQDRRMSGAEKLDENLIRSEKMKIAAWTQAKKINDPAGSGETINANDYFLANPSMVIGKIDASGTMNGRGAALNVRLDDPGEFDARLDKAIANLPSAPPRADAAERTLKHFERMADGMRLAAQRVEPGQVKIDADGAMQTIVVLEDEDNKSIMASIPLTKGTPFSNEYMFRIDGKWEASSPVLNDQGKPMKIEKDGKPTRFNLKKTTVFDSEKDIPDADKWGEARIARVRAMIPIRNLLKRQLVLETQDAPKKMLDGNRDKLNAAYDSFVDEFGLLHDKENERIAMTMPDGGLILGAERIAKDKTVSKAAIMTRRVAKPPAKIERVENMADAIAVSLSETGGIDLGRIGSLMGKDEVAVRKELEEANPPRAFFDPETNQWETSDAYLSGLVRRKLAAAQAAGLERNIAALQKVLPEDWDASQIAPTLGSEWIPAKVYGSFLEHLGYQAASVSYSPITHAFSVAQEGQPNPQWATSGRALPISEIFSRVLNSQAINVVYNDGSGKKHIDEEGTTESQLKAAELMTEFADWAFAERSRRESLVRIFNNKFNARVMRQRDGSHMNFPGKVPDEVIKMRRHQKNAIWRGITDRSVLYDHVVGAGKTFTAIARVMERRRMGLSRKPMVVVPNHLIEQWAADFTKLYPGANVLAASKDDFERGNRRRLFARIAAGDYDAVIVGHSSFGFINLDQATEERYLQDELRRAMKAVEEANDEAKEQGFPDRGKPLGVKEAERLVAKLEARLSRARSKKRDTLLSFEEMGIDDLTVDEAHEFKNLSYSSRLSGIAGMGNKAGSQKALDLHMKVRSLHDRPGTSVVFLTGTPISNSVSEMYLILRNLAPNELREMGLDNFDAWRSMFVSYASAYEPTETGGVKEVARLGREWMNMRSLMDLYYSVADAVTMDDIKQAYFEESNGVPFPIPKIRSREKDLPREMVVVAPSEATMEVLSEIASGFNALPAISDLQMRNATRLRLMDRARKISLDPRVSNPHANVPDGTGKIGAIVNRVAQIWDKTRDDRGAQLVFLDRSVPKSKGDAKVIAEYDKTNEDLLLAVKAGDAEAEAAALDRLEKFDPNEIAELRNAQAGGWNAYDEIKRQLVAKGIPASEIRFVQEASTDKQKEALFEQVNQGEVRILIGSTPRMGAGTNVQKRIVALHHGDVTWKPSDIEQREGRIERQGNELLAKYGPDFTVDIIAYVTEMTVDAKMWALNSAKLKAINGIRKYDGSFNMEFEDEDSASMAEMAALATGNPLMVESVVLKKEIEKMQMQERAFNRTRSAMRDRIDSAKRTIKNAPEIIARNKNLEAIALERKAAVEDQMKTRVANVNGQAYKGYGAAFEAAEAAISAARGGQETGRFAIKVNGKLLTSKDAIDKELRETFGTSRFIAQIDGKQIIRDFDAATALAEKAKGEKAPFTIEGFTINGWPIAVDVTESGGSAGRYTIAMTALDEDGREAFGVKGATDHPSEASATIRNLLGKLLLGLSPGHFEASVKNAIDMEARAQEAAKADADDRPWPYAEDLAQKRERLKFLIGELSQAQKNSIANDPVVSTPQQIRAALFSTADAEAIRRLVDNDAVKIHKTADALPGSGHPKNVVGMTDEKGVIHLVADSLDPAKARAVLLHELFHAKGESLIGSRQWRALLNRVADAADRSGQSGTSFWTEAMRRAAGVADNARAEEVAAYAIEASEAAPNGVADAARRLVGAVKDWLLRRFGLQIGAVTPYQLRSLAIAALRSENTTPGIRQKGAYSVADATPTPQDGGKRSLVDQARDAAHDFITTVMVGTRGSSESVGRYSGLAFIPTRPLFNELAKGVNAAQDYLATKQAMDAMRNAWQEKTFSILSPWHDFARKNKESNRALMDMMHRSTLEQIDPSKPFEEFWSSEDQAALDRANPNGKAFEALSERKAEDDARRKGWGGMRKDFLALPPEAQKIYREVRDAYAALADEGEAQVIANIKKALQRLVVKAKRDHEDEITRIRDEGLTGKERDDAIAAADHKLAHVENRVARNRAARLKNMRQQFESNRLKGPYFPLTRFGNYFVTLRDESGAVVSFSRFESARKARVYAEDQRAAGYSVEEGVATAASGLERSLDPKFVSEVEAILEGANAPDSVRDAIWQKYLEVLPDFSMRKSRLHRKGRAGFQADAMRAFAHNLFHGSHQLARLKYGQDLQEHIELARRQSKEQIDPVRAGALVNEMTLRHDFIMNPKTAPWAQWLSSFAFIWTMGANLSSAIVNLDQTVTKGLPILAYDQDTKTGMAAATKAVMRAARDFAVGKGDAANSVDATDDEKRALAEGYASGLIDRTQAHDVAGVAETGADYNDARHRVMKFMSWPMHQTERFNREVTFLAAYRLARKSGMDHHAAFAKASNQTWMVHYDNQSTSKPRFMQGDIGKVAFALKGFQANLLFRVFRDFHQALHGATPDEKKAALGRFTMTVALTSAAAGVKGMAFYSILKMIAGAVMAALGDDDDPDEKLRRVILGLTGDSVIGKAAGGMLMDGIPGYLTGTSLSGRLGMSDLWFRSNDRDMNADQTWAYWLEQLGGAPLSLAHQMWRGGFQIAEGNVARGVETMLPAAFKNPAKAIRYANEGVRDRYGDEVIEEVAPQDILKQAIGFTPAQIADQYARNNFQINEQNRITDERRKAVQAAARAERVGDMKAANDAWKKIDEFNAKFPTDAIAPKNVRQSIKAMDRNSDQKEHGVKLRRGLEDYIRNRTAPSLYSRD